MKTRRASTAILLLFVAALAAWWALRPTPPPPVGNAPTGHDTAGALPAPMPVASTVSADTPSGMPPSSSAGLVSTPAPAVASSSTPAAVAPRAEPTTIVPDPAVPATTRSSDASVNAIRVRRMVTDYHTLTGENPVGTNTEIMAAVMGKNPRQAVLGPPEGFTLNQQGELVDDWGTPYFFHQLSRDVMEIHSAGPDKIMGTADDIVVR